MYVQTGVGKTALMLLPLLTIYNALAVPILLNRSEIFIFRKKDTKLFSSKEMQFFTRIAVWTLFDKRSEEILGDLKVVAVGKKLRNWLQHVIRMSSSRM